MVCGLLTVGQAALFSLRSYSTSCIDGARVQSSATSSTSAEVAIPAHSSSISRQRMNGSLFFPSILPSASRFAHRTTPPWLPPGDSRACCLRWTGVPTPQRTFSKRTVNSHPQLLKQTFAGRVPPLRLHLLRKTSSGLASQ